MHTLAILAATVLVTAQADTTAPMRRGDRLVIDEITGAVTITGWARDEIEVRDDEQALGVRRFGSTVRVERAQTRRRSSSVEATIRVPRWVEVEVGSRSLDVTVNGVDGALRIGNISGDVRVTNAAGAVDVRSIRGEIRIADATGPIRASSQSDDVTLERVSGSVEVHSGDGNIVLQDVRSGAVRAEAQDGDVDFSGVLAPGGEYGFFLHDGDARLALPVTTGAHVSVSTFDGEFSSEFVVRVERFRSGREFDFVLGDGRATVRIEVFDGEIRLLQRP